MTLERIEGRRSDVTFRLDGRAVTVDEIDAALAEIEDLRAWQLEQVDACSYRVKIVGDRRETAAAATEILSGLYGSAADIHTAATSALSHEPSGKFRFARTLFTVDHATFCQ